MPERVTVMPCSGLTRIEGTISRQAGYKLVEELRPNKCNLCCMPALYVDVEEDVEFITNFPVITIEGCEKCCSAKLVELKGQKAKEVIIVPEILREENISLEGESLKELGEEGEKAAELVAKICAEEVDKLLSEE